MKNPISSNRNFLLIKKLIKNLKWIYLTYMGKIATISPGLISMLYTKKIIEYSRDLYIIVLEF